MESSNIGNLSVVRTSICEYFLSFSKALQTSQTAQEITYEYELHPRNIVRKGKVKSE